MTLALVCIALLMRAIQVGDELYPFYRQGTIITFISAIIILLLGLTDLAIIFLLVATVVLLLVPALYGVLVWIKAFGGAEIPIAGVEE